MQFDDASLWDTIDSPRLCHFYFKEDLNEEKYKIAKKI